MSKIYCDVEITETKSLLDQVCCNICGTVATEQDDLIAVSNSWVSVSLHFGFYSKKDGTHHSADFCEDCWDKLCDSFVVPVTVDQDW